MGRGGVGGEGLGRGEEKNGSCKCSKRSMVPGCQLLWVKSRLVADDQRGLIDDCAGLL